MNWMAVLSGSVPVRFGSLPVPRFMLARGRGPYRFWNIWGLKVLKTCTPPHTRGNAGEYDHVLSLYGGKETYIRCFFGEAISRVGGAGPGTRGSKGLEHLGPESAENLYSPPSARQCRGIQSMCCLCPVARKPTFVTSSEEQ